MQRFGRIDRIGSKNKFVQLVNFWPNVSLDEYINLNARVENRMTLVDATATGDDNIIASEQADLDYRREQLKKLQAALNQLEPSEREFILAYFGMDKPSTIQLGHLFGISQPAALYRQKKILEKLKKLFI